MDNRPIGIFDSGLGGLTAVKEVIKQLPNESIVYFGDTGRVPYGTRSKETITKYVFQDIKFLLNFNIKLIIIACGTASSVALNIVKNMYDVPIFGVVEPAAKEAVRVSKNGNIGVIGTQGTIKSDSYAKKIKEIAKNKKSDLSVYSKACPLFVPLVENGYIDSEIAYLAAKDYLSNFNKKKIDTLIMGCTHYPLLKKSIKKVLGEEVSLIDPGAQVAKYIRKYLIYNNKQAENQNDPTYRYFVSDSKENFSELGSVFLEKEITDQVEKIDIEKY